MQFHFPLTVPYILAQKWANNTLWIKSGLMLLFVWLVSWDGFCIFKWMKRIKIWMIFVIRENYVKFNCQCPQISFHLNTATFIHFSVVYGCSHAMMAEWVVGTGALRPTQFKTFIWLFIEKFANSCSSLTNFCLTSLSSHMFSPLSGMLLFSLLSLLSPFSLGYFI